MLSYRAATRVDRYPTVNRLHLLLSSRLWHPQDARIWEDAGDDASQLVAFAMLTSRQRKSADFGLDIIVHPQMQRQSATLSDDLFSWALAHADEIARERGQPVMLSTEAGEEAATHIALLARHDFSRVQTGHNLYMARPLTDLPPQHTLPKSFTLRPLAGKAELDASNALYGFAALNRAHRLALLRDPNYAHLVIVAPDGAFVAYCECSINHEEWARSGQRIGWLDYIETHPDFQRRDLGRAATLAGLHRLRS